MFHEDTTEASDPAQTAVVLCKLFKESKESKFWDWRKDAGSTPDVVGECML